MGTNSKEYTKNYYLKNRPKMLLAISENNKKARLKVIRYYSSNICCVCCGEKEIKFLCVDHINNDGAKHRKEISKKSNGKGGNIYHWLIKNNFPAGFQILCHNCNQAKSYYGVCPHII